MMLDLESVRLFVLAVEFGNLTRAAEAAGTVQPVVSQRVKALEATLGRKLLDRTPRFVRPTEEGKAFLAKAKSLLSAHDEALRFSGMPAVRFSFGASDHALGLGLEKLLFKVRAALPTDAVIDVQIGMSHAIHERFNAGALDAAIVRRDGGGSEGEVLGKDPIGWRVSERWAVPQHGPVPLAMLPAPCGVRASAIRHLDEVNIPWREAFVGGSCAALLAAANAGLGVAPMGDIACAGAPDLGPELGLPVLPVSEIVLFARASSGPVADAIRALAAAIRFNLS
jgi:DNA-binding transcriptional LysR family regulator